MKQNSLYYLLFVLLIMGTFASMAQNDYGMPILGLVAFSFGILFALQLWPMLIRKEPWNSWRFLELISLVLLAVILGLRVFYIQFVLVKLLFGLSGALLASVYINKLVVGYRLLNSGSQWMSWLMICFYLSLVLYTLSMVATPFLQDMILPLGSGALLLLIVLIVLGFIQRNLLVNGEKVSVFRYVYNLQDRSVILISLYLLFTMYVGFTRIGVLPKLYSDEFPMGYFQLVEEAEKGKARMVNGKFKHDEFREMHDRFLERHPQ